MYKQEYRFQQKGVVIFSQNFKTNCIKIRYQLSQKINHILAHITLIAQNMSEKQ